MSDLKKWMNIVTEQLQPTIINPPEKNNSINTYDTVLISPEFGGGIGRVQGAGNSGTHQIDVKGISMEIPSDQLSLSRADGTNPLVDPINDIMNINVLKGMSELLRDRPDPQTGDLVRVDNVFGTGIGPGFGVFMAYSTSGQEAIISFDDTVITVPVEQISRVAEQEASDEFEKTGNDGALSPMSLTTNNRKTIGDEEMSHKEDFSAWISAVEEGLLDDANNISLEVPLGSIEGEGGDCGCGEYDCAVCFPDDAVIGDETCPHCGHELHVDSCGYEDELSFDYDSEDEFDFGNGEDMIVLADTYSDDDIEADIEARGPEDSIDPVERELGQLQGPGRDPVAPPSIAGPSEDVSELIGKIQYMQDMGLSASDKHYDVEQLLNIKDANLIRRISDKVTGNVHENQELYGDDTVRSKIYEEDDDDTTSDGGEPLKSGFSDLASKFKKGEISEDEVLAKVSELLQQNKGSDDIEPLEDDFGSDGSAFGSEELVGGAATSECDDGCAQDELSPIEQKIAIAKAALERKKSGVAETDTEVEQQDHGLRSLGNKIVNAKLANASKSIYSESSATPDEEVMEWVKRFADRDNLVKENTRKPVVKKAEPTKLVSEKVKPAVKEHKDADAETMAWVARFNKLDNR